MTKLTEKSGFGERTKGIWKHMPRKIKVVCCGISLLAVLLIFYVILGCPAFSVEEQYRRVEKSQLVGPAQILGIVDTPTMDYEHLLLARDEHGVILYAYTELPFGMMDRLVYRERKGDLMVLSGISLNGFLNRNHAFDLPVVIFHEEAEAVSAKAEIRIPDREQPYIVETRQGGVGYFVGEMHHEQEKESTGLQESDYLERFLQCSDSTSMADPDLVIMIHVWLYDENGAVIRQESLELRSVAGEAAKWAAKNIAKKTVSGENMENA